MIGQQVGPYRVLDKLGEGGMGEVYRAKDTKLNRDVALKILPEMFTADADRLARFKREAQVLASLNHPNIAAIYGFEDSGATHALVMELVEGEDLSAHIARGPIHLSDALPIARQIIDALEAAHEQGIVHRDLKPQNIKVKADGTVKVLDFGLAKAMDANASGASADAMNSPTLTARATQMGMILGTAAYMSPEQARGKAVDRRADIWAFGVVLYEMLAGQRAFEGEDISITLASVLKEDVDWSALPPDLPASLPRLLRRCLEKDPKKRLGAIGDARFELDEREVAPVAAASSASPTAPRRNPSWPIVTAVLAVLWLVTLVPASLVFRTAPDPPRIEFSVETPVGSNNAISTVSVSPDGTQLAYVAPEDGGGANLLWVRPLGASQAHALPGTDGATQVFWSPDGQELGYFGGATGRLRKVDLRGGRPQDLAVVPGSMTGATWNSTGDILFTRGTTAGNATIVRIPSTGGLATPAEVLRPDATRHEIGCLWPAFLPDGRHFLFLSWSTDPGGRAIYAASLDGGAPTLIVSAESRPMFVRPGWLLYVRGGALVAQPFDAARLRVTGDPVRVADRLIVNLTNGRAAFGASDSGVLAFRTGAGASTLGELAWFDRAGKALGTVGEAGPYYQIRLSPDEKRVAIATTDEKAGGYGLHTLDLGNNIISQLTFEAGLVNDPVWSPDSTSVMFESQQKGKRDFYHQAVGSRTTTLDFESPDDPKWLDDWSHDGKYLLFHLPTPAKLFAVPLGNGKPVLLAESKQNIDGAHFSPDGKWVAFEELNDSGEFEVWVAAFPAFDNRRQVSAHGGGQPWFRGDGRELFYLTPDGQMMSVAITADPSKAGAVEFHAPVVLFQSPLRRPNLTIDQYSVTRDGQRFLFIRPRQAQATAVDPITVIVNWATGLVKR